MNVAVRFGIRLTPRAGRDTVDGPDADGRLRVRVAAPPVDGAANLALIRLLAAELEVARSNVTIETGEGSRLKRVLVQDIYVADVVARWPGIAARQVEPP